MNVARQNGIHQEVGRRQEDPLTLIHQRSAATIQQMNTIEQARKVRTKAEFVSHLQALAGHAREHPEDIQNCTVEAFLEGIASWIEDSEGFYLNQGRAVPHIEDWGPIAEMMSAGLAYE